MACCSYCQTTKGKRTCPALGGQICSLCCGRHRLKEIDCPADCLWPGGLALARRDEADEDSPPSALETAIAKLAAYARSGSETRNGWRVRAATFGDADADREGS